MAADIIPVLSAVTGLDPAETAMLFSEAWAEAKAANGGRSDSRTYTEAVLVFRSAVPFELADLQMAWKAKEEIESEHASTIPSNALPAPR